MGIIGRFQRINMNQITEAMRRADMKERIEFNDVNLKWLIPPADHDFNDSEYLDWKEYQEPTVKGTDNHPASFYIARIRNGSTFDDIKRDVPSITMNHIVACFRWGKSVGLI